MKNKKIMITAAIAVVVVVGVGIGFWQWQKVKTDKIKADTVTLELEGYNLAISTWLPKEKFNYEIEKSKTGKPLPFPTLQVRNKDDTYRISFSVEEGLTELKQSNYDKHKKEPDFKDIKGDEKKGTLTGYSYTSKYGVRTVLGLKDVGEDTYRLNVNVVDVKDAEGKSKQVYEREEVQRVIESIRLIKGYKAPERDYYMNSRANIIVKKTITKEIDGFKVNHRNLNASSFEMEAKKSDGHAAVVEIYSSIHKGDLDKLIAEDYEVKEGQRKYAEKKKLADYQVALDGMLPGYGETDRLKFYAAVGDGKIVGGVMIYTKGDRAIGEKLLEEILKNAEFYQN